MAMVQAKSIIYRKLAAHAFLWGFLALIIFPLLMIIAISFRTGNFAVGDIIPSHPTLDHWRLALGISIIDESGRTIPPPFPVLLWLWNSVKVASVSAVLIVALSTTCAYAFARLRFGGRSLLLKAMLVFQMFPAVLALVAYYALFSRISDFFPPLGLNTHPGLIFAYLGGIALHVWTIKGYFETIDKSLEESATLDGASPWQAFRLILLPLSVPMGPFRPARL